MAITLTRRALLAGIAHAGLATALPKAFAVDDGGLPSIAGFERGLERAPWLAMFDGLEVDALGPTRLETRGTLPAELRGTLYRNGPGRFERGGQRYAHWFDGDGLVQAWTLGDDGATHRARFVETRKFVAERDAGRFLYNGSGSRIPGAIGPRNVDDVNPANISVAMIGGELHALWEGGSAWKVDADSLQAGGARSWGEGLQSLPFSAHPCRERDGSLWNIGSLQWLDDGELLVWRIGADGRLGSVTRLQVGHRGYVHSFAMTERELLVVLSPLILERLGEVYFDAMRWQPEQGALLLVIDKNDPSRYRRVDLPPCFCFHWADATRGADGSLRLDGALHSDYPAFDAEFHARMRGKMPSGARETTRWATVHVPAQGAARIEFSDLHEVEFPDFARHVDGPRRYRWGLQQPVANESGYYDSVMRLDTHSGQVQHFRYGDHHVAEEHLFVPRPGARAESDGWVVGTAMDYRARTMQLSVFDAAAVDAGPLWQARLPRALPLSLHATFAPA